MSPKHENIQNKLCFTMVFNCLSKKPVEILVLNDLYELDMLRISGFRFTLSGTVIDKCWHKSPVQYLE